MIAYNYNFQGKYAEAKSYYERATEKWEKTLGPGHQTVAMVVVERAELARKLASVFPLIRIALAFCRGHHV